MLRLLRLRDFRLLWLGGFISMMGDWALVAALPFEVYRRTGSTLATAGIILASLAPAVLFGSTAGVFVDRWDRRRLMVWVNVALGAALLPLLSVDALGMWIVYAVLIVSTILQQLFIPAEVALLPQLVGDEDLVAANSLSALNRNLARLVGPAIGGAAVAFGGLPLVVLTDAASFVTAAILIALIAPAASSAPARALAEHAAAATRSAFGRLADEWRDGLAVTMSNRMLRALLVFSLLTGLGEGVVGALFVPWVSDILGGDNAAFAALLSTQAIGGLIGAFIIGKYFRDASPALMLSIGAIAFGLIDLVLFTYPVFVPIVLPALIGMVIVGVPSSAIGVGRTTLQQTLTVDSHRGRVIGLFGTVMALGMIVGTTIAGLLGELIGIVPLLIVQGSGYALGGLVILVAARSSAGPATTRTADDPRPADSTAA